MVSLLGPSPEEVLARLARGGSYHFRPLRPKRSDSGTADESDSETDAEFSVPPPAVDVLDADKSPEDLAAALRSLYRRSNQAYLDRGVRVLYLAFGTLTWIDEDGSHYASPLLLIPVQLDSVGATQGAELKAAPEDPVVNPALALKLSRSGIELPRVDDVEDVSVAGILAAVEAVVAVQDGWLVSDSLLLSNFSFAKEAMYRDLLDHEDQIAAHPVVAALASGGRGEAVAEFVFDEISDGEIDRRAAPEITPVILDADSSQRASIAAALDGRSFVMDGPPGTGKSQTITNMIGVLLHAGKTVLFVSEKAAALDVVRDRLDDAGLRSYVLDLHSHKATRKQVAVALGTTLDNVPVPKAPMPAMDIDAARKRREQLNAYADAMNRPRPPLGYSLHYVLGMIAKLKDVPAAPATGIAPVDLTVELFGEIRATAQRLSGAWRPARQGRTFVWRGVVEQGSLDSRLYQAESALDTLSGMTHVNAVLADAAELTRPSDAAALARLLDHLSAKPPGLPEEWLTADSLDAVGAAIADLAGHLADIGAREQDAGRAAGVPWLSVPRSGELPVLDAAALAALVPAAIDVDSASASQITHLSTKLAAGAEMLEDCLGSLSGLAAKLGVCVPQTFPDAGDLLTLARAVQAPCRPERAWLSASGLRAAHNAARTLSDAWQAVGRAETYASVYYTPALLDLDVEELAHRFGSEHHGLGRLSAEYRADKKTLASFTRDGASKDSAHQYLSLAVAWKQAVAALSAAEAAHAPGLGTYYTGGSTDWNRIASALSLADTVIRAAGGQDLAGAAGFIGCDAVPDAATMQLTDAVIRDLNAWHAALRPITAMRPELVSAGISDAIGWLRAHLAPLRCAAGFTHEVSAGVGHPLTAGRARYLVELRDAADAAHERLIEREAHFADTFGDLHAGARTDVGEVRSAAEWARQLRVMLTGAGAALSPAQVKAADSAVSVSHLAAAADAWQRAQDMLVEAFDVYRRPDLLTELDDFEEARDLIAALRQDPGGKEEWHVYQACRAVLAAYGLDVAVEFCIAERLPAEDMPQVIERALLQEWAEHHLRTDPELFTVRAVDRDALVDEYRQLDRALIAAAMGSIIRACNARRPRTDIGESAVIHREAEKKKKHMPVRALIERSRHVTQAIKPCFMMSPLAVSQYLPSDLHFDVVIFDEASQVSPGDAINCIYRGSALILAGDQKQLPPSSFFTNSTADEEEWSEDSDDTAEFESILDLAKASGSFRSLTLRWHYRSLHEALIAFSNASFYEGKLITFPSTHSDGPDVGVELFWVDGTYRRGGSRDNPEEAAKVAGRVIHHYDTRPELSLGVVTFSEAQAEAIETAVSHARQDRPDLDRFFTNDRLHGFFVKSLESVQGDERDVLIFSIGYGPDENRKITMNFGPLNKQGGWRRLNVAITRARYRDEIVSSIRASDIPESVTTEGLRHLRRYLDYAARGTAALALDTSSAGDAESPFEESVITVIRSWGYELTPQVGTAGYRIDIGVRHPNHPGVYALGVECDGYQYHSSKTARDRDRLREKVLRGLGWNLHRIWGTAWYRDRNGEERKLRTAIEHAIAAPVRGLLTDLTEPGERARPEFQTETATFDQAPPWAVPYITAQVPRLPHWIDPGQPGSDISMIPGIRAVIMTEAPIHTAVLQQRLRDAWDIGRIGPRIRDNIDGATRHMGVIRDGDFLTLTSAPPAIVRTPTDACRRFVEQVHDHELNLALANIVRDAGGISHDELTTCAARLYGWTRRGPDISTRLHTLIVRLLANGTLSGNEHNVTAAEAKEP
jgi:very-short-patch-repair endonuclease